MRWSWRIGKLAGIDLYMHATFLLLPLFVAVQQWSTTGRLDRVIAGVLFILALFACVVLHELGHALTARRYGIRTRDITLLPIGGVARLERLPEDPLQELYVALAGPAVNVVIAGILWVIVGAADAARAVAGLAFFGSSFLANLMVVNLMLAVFNLIPAFPMDGGRVLRSLLARKLDYVRATQIAANVGQGLAIVFAFIGFQRNPFLIFIALFIFFGAGEEAAAVQLRSLFRGIPVAEAMQRSFISLPAQAPLRDAVQALLNGSQQDFPVLEEGRLAGVLFRRDLLRALSELGESAPLARAIRTDVQPVEMGEMLDCVAERMQAEDLPSVPVLRRGQLVGLLTLENIGEFVAVQSARNTFRKTT